jgi:hypothetical protein
MSALCGKGLLACEQGAAAPKCRGVSQTRLPCARIGGGCPTENNDASETCDWFGLDRLHDATVATIETPSVQERLKEVGAMTVAPERRSPEYMQKFVASEIEKNAAPLKAAGISMD